jgi:diguanylate cyclase (GGDEF)-like protein
VINPTPGDQLERDGFCPSCGQRLGYWSTDKLTGLLDRWGWDERAEQALARAANRATALLLIDLDGFDRITERHGQPAANTVLQAAASVLKEALRTTDVLGRYGHGGDEFLVLLPARDRQLGELIARRIRARIRRAIIPVRDADGETVVISRVTVSIGAAVTDPSTGNRLSLSELLRQADAALVQAQHNGGDQILVAGGGVSLAG